MTNELSRQDFLKLTAGRRARYSFRRGISWGFDGGLLALPMTAVAMATAKRGEKIATGVGTASSLLTFPIYQGAIAAGISLIPGVGPAAALFTSMFAAAFPAAMTENFVSRAVRSFSKVGGRIRSLETGQDFQDNEFNTARRSQALMELARSVQPSRRYLGQEARFLHR